MQTQTSSQRRMTAFMQSRKRDETAQIQHKTTAQETTKDIVHTKAQQPSITTTTSGIDVIGKRKLINMKQTTLPIMNNKKQRVAVVTGADNEATATPPILTTRATAAEQPSITTISLPIAKAAEVQAFSQSVIEPRASSACLTPLPSRRTKPRTVTQMLALLRPTQPQRTSEIERIANSSHIIPLSSTADKAPRVLVDANASPAGRMSPPSKRLDLLRPRTQIVTSSSSGVPPFVGFPLPVSCSLLVNVFNALECAMGVRSLQTALFSTIKKPIEMIAQRTVDRSHLQQIVSVFPASYSLLELNSRDEYSRVVKDIKITRLSTHTESNNEQPSSADTTADAVASSAATSSPLSGVESPSSAAAVSTKRLTERRQMLQSKLLDVVLQHHQRFLASRTDTFDVEKEQCWHPAFPLEDVPPIPLAPIKSTIAPSASAAVILEQLLTKKPLPIIPPTSPFPSIAPSSVTTSSDVVSPYPTTPSTCVFVSLQQTPSSPFTSQSSFIAQFRRRSLVQELERPDRPTPEQLQRLQHMAKLPQLLDLII